MKLLTAKPELVRREAQIVASAGMPGSVTLATNMAGDSRASQEVSTADGHLFGS